MLLKSTKYVQAPLNHNTHDLTLRLSSPLPPVKNPVWNPVPVVCVYVLCMSVFIVFICVYSDCMCVHIMYVVYMKSSVCTWIALYVPE